MAPNKKLIDKLLEMVFLIMDVLLLDALERLEGVTYGFWKILPRHEGEATLLRSRFGAKDKLEFNEGSFVEILPQTVSNTLFYFLIRKIKRSELDSRTRRKMELSSSLRELLEERLFQPKRSWIFINCDLRERTITLPVTFNNHNSDY